MRGERMELAKVIARRKFNRKWPCPIDKHDEDKVAWRDNTIRMCRKTTTDCSCAMCGNPRKFKGAFEKYLTIQELRAFQREE